MLRAEAYAKLNLALHVLGKRPDGYHELESIVAFCDVADVITVAEAKNFSLQVTGSFALAAGAVHDNLVLRAARLLAAEVGYHAGAAITLEKNIPVGAGLGGGSADAAAVLKLLCALWGVLVPADRLRAVAVSLGADVPMCLQGGVLRVQGIGDIIESFIINDIYNYSIVLLYPNKHVSTTDVYGAWQPFQFGDSRENGDPKPLLSTLARTRNDLQHAAIRMAPEIAEALLALETLPQQPDFVRMTGSGSCCFALFDEAERATSAVAWLEKKYPVWWVKQAQFVV